jgi:hypothetical protein
MSTIASAMAVGLAQVFVLKTIDSLCKTAKSGKSKFIGSFAQRGLNYILFQREMRIK